MATKIDTFLTNIPISEEECIGDSLQWINSALITLSGGFATTQTEMAKEYLTIATAAGYIKNTGDAINGTLQIGPLSPTVNTAAKLIFGKTTTTTQSELPTITCGSIDGLGNDLYLTASSANGKVVLRTGTNTTEALRATSDQKVGINSSGKTLESTLDVYGGVSIRADASGNALFIGKNSSATTGANYDRLEFKMDISNQIAYIGTAHSGIGTARALTFRTAGVDRLHITTGGVVGIGTVSPTGGYAVDIVGGDVRMGNGLKVIGGITCQTLTQLSDIQLKENITRISDSLNKVNLINGVEFDWKDLSGKDYGVIAQDVEKVYPLAVKEGKDGIKTVNYSALIPLLIEAIKDLTAEVNALKAAQN